MTSRAALTAQAVRVRAAGVTEGDITPGAMKRATFATLACACLAGCILVWLYGSWWMYLVGIATALGVMAYSAGPYPLSHHGFGEVAVICFFGIIPVTLTYTCSWAVRSDGGWQPQRPESD